MENFLRVLFLHNDKVIGAVAAMFLLTCMVLLIRSLRAEEDDGQGSLNRRDPLLDLSAIEGAMRRVLSAQELAAEKSVVGGGATSKINLTGENIGDAIESSEGSEKTEGAITSTATSSSPDKKSETVAADPQKLAEMKAQMAARDKKIAALEEQMKRPQADGGGSAADLEALKSEIANLQGRLAEYEVIEDDIADLSLFREEKRSSQGRSRGPAKTRRQCRR